MLSRVLGAVSDAEPRIVVGPAQPVPDGVLVTRENPPSGGPVAALAAGLSALDALGEFGVDPASGRTAVEFVAVLAADQPFVTGTAVGALRGAADQDGADGAVFVDGDRPQYLCGVWRIAALHRGLVELGDPDGVAVRLLLAALRFVPVSSTGLQPQPWFDCDTAEDLATAERLARLTPPR